MTIFARSARTAVWLCAFALITLGGTANADMRLGTSSDAGVERKPDLGNRLTNLLGQERQALSRINIDRMRVITAAPKISLRPTKRGAAPAQISYTREWLNNQPVASGNAEWECLTQALYFEARGESVAGQFAVAEVILNRVDSSRFPNTVCAVVNQGTGRRHQCQFSYTCDGKAEVVNEPAAYDNVGKIARALLDGAPRNLTVGATYYHNQSVRPRWSRTFTRTASIDGHLFYR